LNENIKLHQRVQLDIPEGQYKGNYFSRIEGIIDDGIIVVTSPPVADSLKMPLNAGETINVFYWDMTAQYAFEARVVDRKIGSTTPTITLEKCSEIQRMQRRSFFRIQARLRVVHDVEREGEECAELRHYEGQTLNISGGGMLLSTKIKLELGDNLPLKLYLSEQEYIAATGRVERIEFLSTRDLYRAGIVFTIINEYDRDKIIAFVFKKEIELRKKGLL
jgi:c-di-GMP-binding flagellar brake protein YcgR